MTPFESARQAAVRVALLSDAERSAALGAVADKIARFARKEGLEGHARSALSRFGKG